MKNRNIWMVISLLFMAICINVSSLKAEITDGEKLTFDVSYGAINAAEASLEIRSEELSGTPIWLITSTASTKKFFDSVFKVRDTVLSYWEKDNLRSLRFSKRLNEGAYQQYRVHTYDHTKKSSTYQRWNFKKNLFKTKQIAITQNTQDILSAFYYVRQQNLVPGKSVLVNVTTDGKAYTTEVVVHRRETIDSIFGKKQCLLIEPKLKGEAVFKQSGRILIWVTDDIYKIPLRMTSKITVGAFTASLKSAKNVPYPIK